MRTPRSAGVDGWARCLATGLLLGVPAGLAHAAWRIVREGWLSAGLHRLAAQTLADSLTSLTLLAMSAVLGVGMLSSRFARGAALPVRLAARIAGLALLLPLASPLVDLLRRQWEVRHSADLSWSDLSSGFLVPAFVWLSGLGAALFVSVWSRRWRARGEGTGAVAMHRPRLAVAVGASALAIVLAVRLEGLASSSRGPDVVLITIDSLRADHLDLYGYSRETAPALKRLAGDAVLYRKAVSTAPWTTPALASALTGRYPARFGYAQTPSPLPRRAVLLAEVLRNAGYRTYGVVANLFGSRVLGFGQGFEVFDDTLARGHDFISSQALTARAIDLLDRRGRSPLFLYLLYFDPHFSYALHREFDFDPHYSGKLEPLLSVHELRRIARRLAERDLRYIRSLYDSELRYTDHNIGLLMKELKARGLYDEALIVVFSDHGEEFAERGTNWIGHTVTLWEELLHVPLLIKYPGNQGAGSVVDAPVSIMDIAPTVLAAADIDFPTGMDGRALLPDHTPSRPLVSETRRDADLRSIRSGPWKLIVDSETGRASLYRLDRDPKEQNDLSAIEPARRDELLRLLEDWEKEITASRSAVGPDMAPFSEEQKRQLRSLGYLD